MKIVRIAAYGDASPIRSRDKHDENIVSNITSWFAIALAAIRTRRILREKADCKQSNSIRDASSALSPNTFIHSRSSLENHTRFQTKMGKFRPKKLQNPTLWGGTYTYMDYIREYPHSRDKNIARTARRKVHGRHLLFGVYLQILNSSNGN